MYSLLVPCCMYNKGYMLMYTLICSAWDMLNEGLRFEVSSGPKYVKMYSVSDIFPDTIMPHSETKNTFHLFLELFDIALSVYSEKLMQIREENVIVFKLVQQFDRQIF